MPVFIRPTRALSSLGFMIARLYQLLEHIWLTGQSKAPAIFSFTTRSTFTPWLVSRIQIKVRLTPAASDRSICLQPFFLRACLNWFTPKLLYSNYRHRYYKQAHVAC